MIYGMGHLHRITLIRVHRPRQASGITESSYNYAPHRQWGGSPATEVAICLKELLPLANLGPAYSNRAIVRQATQQGPRLLAPCLKNTVHS